MMVISGNDARILRNKFINTFVDKNSKWYHTLVEQVQESQGKYYYGYLWDSLFREHLEIVGMDFVINNLRNRNYIYVFWDNHPKSYFTYRNPNWEYPRNCLLRLSFPEWEGMKDLLPEDCYIFDDTMTWAIALTHEESSTGCSICYYLKV